MKANEIQDLLDFISKSGLDEVNIETSEIKLKVKKNTTAKIRQNIIQTPGSSMPADSTALVSPTPAYYQSEKNAAEEKSADSKKESAEKEEENNYVTIKSPMIGTFYRSPNPDSDAFIKIGDKVSAGQTVCIIEAMKLFNEIEAEQSGTLVKILADDASPVEYDQPLFLIDPS